MRIHTAYLESEPWGPVMIRTLIKKLLAVRPRVVSLLNEAAASWLYPSISRKKAQVVVYDTAQKFAHQAFFIHQHQHQPTCSASFSILLIRMMHCPLLVKLPHSCAIAEVPLQSFLVYQSIVTFVHNSPINFHIHPFL